MRYRILVTTLKLAVQIARSFRCSPKENFRDAMGDAGVYRLLGR
jgi:hypothetical protein